MTRILYSIANEGMGHATRAEVMVPELAKRHEVLLLAGGRRYDHLKKFHRNILRIHDFDLVYTNNSVNIFASFIRNLFRFPFILLSFVSKLKAILRFRPQVIISDFEPLSNYLSYILKVLLISLDNQHVSAKCIVHIPQEFRKTHRLSAWVMSFIISNAQQYVITSFFPAKPRAKNVIVLPPIIRNSIRAAQSKSGPYIFVYQTSESNSKLIPALRRTPHQYIFYGKRSGKEGNIIFKKFNEGDFVKDLASCRAVITNGGFQLISEAIFLHKPILSIPIRGQFEQVLNAMEVKRQGFGTYVFDVDSSAIEGFITNLSEYRKGLKRFIKYGNSELVGKLQRIIDSI
ncbi:MAG TPA: MJ1255/VC2487 family glycosyltransferase [Candidatus Nanoarchaeia archaeon]|nr:MJ1255/VC2487 family glycosyltransferase [Candidatus Nanoarchaeia archaeon]